jgi:hypothetical protein
MDLAASKSTAAVQLRALMNVKPNRGSASAFHPSPDKRSIVARIAP